MGREGEERYRCSISCRRESLSRVKNLRMGHIEKKAFQGVTNKSKEFERKLLSRVNK